MQCPKCKAEVSGKFCRQCGTAVALPVEEARRAGVCPSCGAGVRPEQKFCPKCAEPLGAAVARVAAPAPAPTPTRELCWQCGSELKPGAKFCNSCGRPSPGAGAGRATAPTAIEAPTPFQEPFAPTAPQFEKEAGPRNASATAAFVPSAVSRAFPESDASAAPRMPTIPVTPPPPPVTRPVPRPLPPLDSQRTPAAGIPAIGASSGGNQKAILFACVVVLGLAFGGLIYWYVLRKPAAGSTSSQPSVSQTATAAVDKPSPAQSTTPAADAGTPAEPAATTDNSAPGQSSAPVASATDTKPAASDNAGAAPAKSAPAKSTDTAPRAAADLSGFWEGEYTNTNQVSKVTLQIAKDSGGLLAGTMVFDDGGINSARCTIKGAYNAQNKFMVLQVAKCQGQPPTYLEGKIGFASVELSARQAFGVDSAHNSFLNISRQ